uniref:Leucine-rich repeat-containing N-terminal plant-type domain-containing protein n=1 Tax=Manihot esculenta TaxID=3983 RepID=A0A2C9VJ01_MANES
MLNLVFGLVLTLVCCLVSPHHACNQFDHESLLSFSYNVSSSPPLNWSPSIDCCLWEGIGCDGDGQVTSLWLPSRGIVGVFSFSSIRNLKHLSQLNLSHNQFSGPLESFLSLVALETLDLSYNLLHGELPSLFSSKNIKLIDLSSNNFYGEIPSTFFQQAANLVSFNISNNSFTGSIPSSVCLNSSLSVKLLDFSGNDFGGLMPKTLGQCSQLQVFRAGFNNLSGPFPQDIFKVVSLQEISLPLNSLSGPISPGITNLTNLKILELYGNQLTGVISPDIGKLSNLEQLLLHINYFAGPLPTSLANCTNLFALNLRFNNLEGDLSTFNFSKLVKLRILDLGNNNFTGSLPLSLYSCWSLTAVRLSFNQFEGQILPKVVDLKYMSFLSLSHNNLTNATGAISILMRLKNLRILLLSRNFQNESMPNEDKIGQSGGFQNLQILALGGCLLNGQIPGWLAKLQKLQVLDLSFNRIIGEFPRELNLMPALASTEAQYAVDTTYLEAPVLVQTNNAINPNYQQYIKLSHLPPAIYIRNNNLRGNIPVELGQLKLLHVLDLSNNNFSGSIPSELSKLTNLEKLDLSGNHLTGEIPASFKGLNFLSSFSVADNNLEGPVPSGGQFDTFPVSSFSGNPGLCGSIVQYSCSDQPQTTSPVPEESSENTLVFGLIAGLTFGFVVGSTTGLLYPIRRLKFLEKFIRFLHRNERRNSHVSPLYSTS